MSKQETIERIADYFTVPIPHRPHKPAKARKSWRTLEVGREIRNTKTIVVVFEEAFTDTDLVPGSCFRVTSVDETGVWVQTAWDRVSLRLEDTKWAEKFEKIPKRRSKRSS